MSDLVKRLRMDIEPSEGDMEDAADLIEAQAARIAELEATLQEATRLLLQAHDTIFRLHDNSDVAARNLITKIRLGFSGTTTGGKDG